MNRIMQLGIAVVSVFTISVSSALACQPTGFAGLTAALVNPTATVSGPVDGSDCSIGVYYDSTGIGGTVKGAEIFGALYYGVMVNGDGGAVSVDVLDSQIHDIGDRPLNGNQRGVGIYYRAFLLGASATGKVNANTFDRFQKAGIVVNGGGSNVITTNNVLNGHGPVSFIAQNGIQYGYGSSGSVMKNQVTGNSYTGTSAASGGILVVGGPGYGTCPDGNACPYTTGIQIMGNTVVGADVGVFLSNLAQDGSAPESATNIKVVNNTITNDALNNNYDNVGYQAGVSDVGNNDKIINDTISGAGYDPDTNPDAYLVKVDADASFTNRVKVHAIK